MPAKKTRSTKTATKKTLSPKKRTASTKAKSTKTKSPKAGEAEVTIDRRTKADRREESEAEAPKIERREKVQRRRQIDPTTCERDYSVYEVEFMNAMDEYKRTSGRMFPTCSEVLEVIRALGYVKLTPAELAVVRPEPVKPIESQDDVANVEGEGANIEGLDGEEEFSEEFEPLASGEVC